MKRGPKWFAQKAGRRDGNHAAIRDALRALGHFVVDTAGVGGGVPDLCVYALERGRHHYVRSAPVWLEVKTLTGTALESQLDWRAAAESRGVRVEVARTIDEALEVLRG